MPGDLRVRVVVTENRAHIIGVSVSDTTAETMIVTLKVTANSRKSRPTMSLMKSSGISTAMSETVSEMIVNPIVGALEGGLQRRLAGFDIARDVLDHDDRIIDDEAGEIVSAISVRLFRLKPARYMTAKVPTSDSGTATLGSA